MLENGLSYSRPSEREDSSELKSRTVGMRAEREIRRLLEDVPLISDLEDARDELLSNDHTVTGKAVDLLDGARDRCLLLKEALDALMADMKEVRG